MNTDLLILIWTIVFMLIHIIIRTYEMNQHGFSIDLNYRIDKVYFYSKEENKKYYRKTSKYTPLLPPINEEILP